MEKSLNNKVLEKVDEIISHIEDSNNYKKYKEIETKMKKDTEIMTKINKIKAIQKEVVKLEVEKKDVSLLEKDIDEIMVQLNSFPIYQEYTYLLEDLNNTFQNIKSIIESYLNNKIN